jgi:hypothetical protein
MWNQVRMGGRDMTPGHLKPEIKKIFIIIIRSPATRHGGAWGEEV